MTLRLRSGQDLRLRSGQDLPLRSGHTRIVVVGGGPAGTFAAIAAKKQDPTASVILLTREACEPYEKPPLSKAVLIGAAQPEAAPIAGPSGVSGHDVALEVRADCIAIDRTAREVVLGDGRQLPYDALVIATGATARELSLLPIGMPRVHYLRTEGDARALTAALRSASHLLVVGGGLIGLEVAASAATLGLRVTVLEAAPRILSRVCDEETAACVATAHAQHGVEIRVSTLLASATSEPDGRVAAVTSTGDCVIADLAVVGTGSAPDTALAARAGLPVSDGIVVDAHCRTEDPAIFAAGDCVRFPGPNGLVRLENWIHAQDHGMVAGRNAAGAHDTYAAVPSFWSEQYDLYLQGVGWPATGSARIRRPLDGNRWLAFDIDEGRLTSAIGINAQREIAVARRLIERRISVDAGELADPSKPLAAMLKR